MRREDQARTWVAREINRRRRDSGFPQDVPPECWREEGVARAVGVAVARLLQFPAGEWDDLADEADGDLCEALDDVNAALNALSVYWPGTRPDGLVSATRSRASLLRRPESHRKAPRAVEDDAAPADSDSRRCGDALGEYLAWQMNQDAVVQDFRRRALGDRLFAEETQAWEFLTTRLIQVTPLKLFEEYGLCPATAVGRVDIPPLYCDMLMNITSISKTEEGPGDLRKRVVEVTAEFERPGESSVQTVLRFTTNTYMCVGFPPYRTGLPVNAMVSSESVDYESDPTAIPFFEIQGVERYVEGMNDSVTCEAMHAGHHLTGLFPVHIWDALCFLLTGTLAGLQGVRSLAVDYDPYILVQEWSERLKDSDYEALDLFTAAGPHCLYVQPWVQPEELAEHWRRVRPGSAPRTLPKERSLALFRFALRHTPPGERFRWESLAGRWTDETGEAMTRNQMQMTFKRVREALLPGYREGE